MSTHPCQECEGTGWKPIESDGIRRVVRCSCQGDRQTESLLEKARIPRRYAECEFENFHVRKDRASGSNRSLEGAKLFARRFVEEYPTDFGLLFVGPTGVGKTHLAVAVLRELILQKGRACLFYDFRELLNQIKDSYNPISQNTELRVLQPIIDIEVLLLDEMAATSPSDWVRDTMAHIINSRYNQKKVTLITTTLLVRATGSAGEVKTPEGERMPDLERTLNQFGPTLFSRLYEMCKFVEIHSGDFRKEVKQKGVRFHAE